MKPKFLLHTNSEYADVLDLFLSQAQKYELLSRLSLVYSTDLVIRGYECNTYLPGTPYAKRLLDTIKHLDPDSIIGLLHNFILYSIPNYSRIEELQDYLLTSEYDFIRLIKSNDDLIERVSENLFKTNKFAIQATLFKVSYLKRYLEKFNSSSIWELEELSPTFNSNGLFYYDYEPRRGIVHHDSSIFPYMATAVVKGKWNLEYKKELLDLKTYRIF